MVDIQSGVEQQYERLYSVTIEAAKLTGETLIDVLKSAFEQSESNLQELSEHDFDSLEKSEKLENIEVSKDNIGDFAKVAAKYDVDCFIKQDKTAEKPTYKVFFKTKDTEKFQKAFQEYADMKQGVNAEKKAKKTHYLPDGLRKRVVKNIAKYENDPAQREQRSRKKEQHKEQSL